MPSSHSHSTEEPKEKPVSFDELQALLTLAERLQESVDAKRLRLTILWGCIFLLPPSAIFLSVSGALLADKIIPDARTTIAYAAVFTAIIATGLGALHWIILLSRTRALLDRDNRALADVADMLREAGGALGKDLSSVGRFIMRVQTWRLDIGVNPDPNAPRPPGGRASHLPRA
ncbi:hypothetical protein [Polyangium spumosum]|uniref:hypothetical protein n=1 Tax=Polyangium spumosum TaxID=889282 RepID=UPI0014791990|nr:hypothetical protein [Polyangium spumosum]